MRFYKNSDNKIFAYDDDIKSTQLDKLVEDNGLVEVTDAEVSKIQSSIEASNVADALSSLRDEKAINYPYKGIVMRLSDGARTDLTAVYSVVAINQAIPDDMVMMNWQEDGYDNLPITAGDFRADGLKFMQHRQDCFTAAKIVTQKHKETPFKSLIDLEKAFDEAYSSI